MFGGGTRDGFAEVEEGEMECWQGVTGKWGRKVGGQRGVFDWLLISTG